MELVIDYLNCEDLERKDIAESKLDDLRKIIGERENRVILNSIHNNTEENLTREDQLNFILSLLYCGTSEEKEQALLLAYYQISKDNIDGIRLLKDYCEKADEESDEELRGRKHWVRLLLLMLVDEDDQAVENYVRREIEIEKSTYVWERFFAALSRWKESFRIYPEINGWKNTAIFDGGNYRRFCSTAQNHIENTYRFKKGIEHRLPRLIKLTAEEKLEPVEIFNIITAAAEHGADFPLTEDQINNISSWGNKYQQILVNLINKYYSSASNKNKIPGLLHHINNIRSTNDAIYPKYVWSVLSAIEFLKKRRIEKPEKYMFNILNGDLKEEDDRSEVYQSISENLGKILLYMAANNLLNKSFLKDLVNLLEHHSPYYQVLAASTLLQSYRSGYDLTQFKDKLLTYLKKNPSDKNSLATGNDIQSDEYEYTSITTDYSHFQISDNKVEDDGFSLSNLTSLLAQCQPPTSSHRIALLLKEMAINNNDQKLMEELKLIGKQNTVFKEITMNEETKKNTHNFVSRLTQFGPFTVNEIINIFEETSKLNTVADDELLKIGRKWQIKKEEEYIPGISNQQRNLIKSTFADINDEFPEEVTNNNVLRDIFLERRYGKESQATFNFNQNENTPDYFALYKNYNTREGDINPLYGIYFNGFTCLRAIKQYNFDIDSFIRTIAIHELFHSHIDFTMKEKKPIYNGHLESPGRMEEAAANKVAFDWFTNNCKSSHGTDDIFKILFDLAKDNGVEGYGEYEFIDNHAAHIVPRLFSDSNVLTEPKDYKLTSLDKHRGLNPEKNQIIENWKEKVKNFGDNVIPFYFDLSK